MKNNIKANRRSIIAAVTLLFVGILLGWLFFGGDSSENSTKAPGSTTSLQVAEEHNHEEGTTWTCAMHPQIREDGPGQCPVCGMDLIPLASAGSQEAASPYELEMTEAAMKIADVQTSIVQKSEAVKTVYMSGKVKADERRIAEITTRFPGRIEKLYINFTGQEVKKGQKLASVYSPELVTAQKELFEAEKFRETNPGFYTAAINKLKLWNLTEGQINAIAKSKEPRYYFDILSPQSGTVMERNVAVGDYVQEGAPLFRISDLNHVWVMFDAHESDLPWVRAGDSIKFTIPSIPGKTFSSKISFIDPVINPSTRVAGVRAELDNPENLLKPEMWVQGIVQATLTGKKEALVIPKSAVLWTGKRAVVYVKKQDTEKPVFEFREIDLGADMGEQYVVNSGLAVGEEIVTHGVFKVDAAAQLQGKVSMMHPSGSETPADHDPGETGMGSEAPDMQNSETNAMEAMAEEVPEQFHHQLEKVMETYLGIKNVLIEADPSGAKERAVRMETALEKVDRKLLKGDADKVWERSLKKLNSEIDALQEATDLERQRAAFSRLSEAMAETIQVVGLGDSDQPLFLQYCPMSNENKGAYWISELKEIKNPYYGQMMLSCGEIRKTLN